jgi:restriction endonuclease S subunit
LVVIDEITSIINQFNSKLHGDRLEFNQRKLFVLISEAENVIGMDGFLDETSVDLFHYIITNEIKCDEMIYLDINTYKLNPREYVWLNSVENFIYYLGLYLSQSNKIYLPIDSLNEADIIAEIMKIIFPNLRI